MYGPHDFSWVTSEKHCQAKDEIGAGSVGTVYKAVHPTTGQEIAIKRMDRAPLARDATALNGFQREVDMFSRLHHPNIIRLLGVQMEPACHLLIMEQAECELCVPCSLPVLAARPRVSAAESLMSACAVRGAGRRSCRPARWRSLSAASTFGRSHRRSATATARASATEI